MLAELRQRVQALQRPAGIEDDPGTLPLGIAAIDQALGGGLARGALHEIAAASEAHLAAATGFVLGLVSLAPLPVIPGRMNPESRGQGLVYGPGFRARGLTPASRNDAVVWIAEDMALAESGAPYGPGLDGFGLSPERLLTVSVAHRRDLLWAMEEALRCRAVAAVIGELRHDEIDTVAVRRLSLAAAESGAPAFLLRAAPPTDASTAATRWIVGASASVIPGRPHEPKGRMRTNPESRGQDLVRDSGFRARGLTPASRNDEDKPRFATRLTRNRRGPVGSWIIEWSDDDERFALATHAQPVAAPALDRPHRKIA